MPLLGVAARESFINVGMTDDEFRQHWRRRIDMGKDVTSWREYLDVLGEAYDAHSGE